MGEQLMTITLNGSDLTVTQVIAAARHGEAVALAPRARTASSVKGEGIEDRATMAPLSARRLAEMVQLCARVAAIEFVVAAQAIDLRALSSADGGPLGLGTGRAYRMIRELVPFIQADSTLGGAGGVGDT
jgi:histidine ammonia-lyase